MHDFPGNQEELADPGSETQAAFAARITEAAYEVALRHGVQGSFADLELDLWRRIQSVVAATNPVTGRVTRRGNAA
jgi:hypothetical protein